MIDKQPGRPVEWVYEMGGANRVKSLYELGEMVFSYFGSQLESTPLDEKKMTISCATKSRAHNASEIRLRISGHSKQYEPERFQGGD